MSVVVAGGEKDAGSPSGPVAIEMVDVAVWTADGTVILCNLTWTVRCGEQWALLGPNGAGKSTLLALAGAVRHPSAGAVTVLGGRLGRVDMPALRRRIGVVDPKMPLLDWLSVEDVVLTGLTATVRPLPGRYGREDRRRALEMLSLVGCERLSERTIAACSQGERQRVRIARALIGEPSLLLLDEPATGLDFPAREALLAAIAALTVARPSLATVVVTHHLEELPTSTTHALLLRAGSAVAGGAVTETLTSGAVSDCFGLDVRVDAAGGRWVAHADAGWKLAPST